MGDQIIERIVGTFGPTLAAIALLVAPTAIWILVSRTRGESPGKATAPPVDVDAMWLCEGCRSVNAARSKRCYRCQAARSADAPAAAEAIVASASSATGPGRLRSLPPVAASPSPAVGPAAGFATAGLASAGLATAGLATAAASPAPYAISSSFGLPASAGRPPAVLQPSGYAPGAPSRVAVAPLALLPAPPARSATEQPAAATHPAVQPADSLPISSGVPIMAEAHERVAVPIETASSLAPSTSSAEARPAAASRSFAVRAASDIATAAPTAGPPASAEALELTPQTRTSLAVPEVPSAEPVTLRGGETLAERAAVIEVRTTCPLLTVRGRPGVVFSYANADHQCQANARPSQIDPAHQLAFCLSGGYRDCQRYLALADRVARAR